MKTYLLSKIKMPRTKQTVRLASHCSEVADGIATTHGLPTAATLIPSPPTIPITPADNGEYWLTSDDEGMRSTDNKNDKAKNKAGDRSKSGSQSKEKKDGEEKNDKEDKDDDGSNDGVAGERSARITSKKPPGDKSKSKSGSKSKDDDGSNDGVEGKRSARITSKKPLGDKSKSGSDDEDKDDDGSKDGVEGESSARKTSKEDKSKSGSDDEDEDDDGSNDGVTTKKPPGDKSKKPPGDKSKSSSNSDDDDSDDGVDDGVDDERIAHETTKKPPPGEKSKKPPGDKSKSSSEDDDDSIYLPPAVDDESETEAVFENDVIEQPQEIDQPENESDVDPVLLENTELDWLEGMEQRREDGTADDLSVTDEMIQSLLQETSEEGQISLQAAKKIMDDLSKKNKNMKKLAESLKGRVIRDSEKLPVGEILRPNSKLQQKRSTISK
jgi:polyhydroxyalkanoate synthesis regulator phasin